MTLFDAIRANDLPSAKRLLQSGADANASGEDGLTPLIDAAGRGLEPFVLLLMNAGADPRLRDVIEDSAVLKAAVNGHSKIVALLAPHSDRDDVAQAYAFLRANGTVATEMRADFEAADSFQRRLVGTAARAAEFFGHEEPQRRMERLERAEAAAAPKKRS